MTEYRVTNGKQESLYDDSMSYDEMKIAHFNRYGRITVEVYSVDNFHVHPMPQTLSQREAQIVPNFWNVCKWCKKQFVTVHHAKNCIRCSSSSLERRKYNVQKNSTEREVEGRNGKGSLQSKDRTESKQGRLRDNQTTY